MTLLLVEGICPTQTHDLLTMHTAGVSDPKRVAVAGGSHGGFLAGHLMGQHPQAFRCGIILLVWYLTR